MTEGKFTTSLSKTTNAFVACVADDFATAGVEYDAYSKKCALAAATSIVQLLKDKGKSVQDLDTSSVRTIVGQAASLKLNADAVPRECYFQFRYKDGKQIVEMGVEGDGYDAMLRHFGAAVEHVYPCWIVKEGDAFTYPHRRGIEIEPPSWTQKGLSEKAVRVVYPVKLTDGTIEYLIAEREGVKTNLFAHVRNNLMNETFGICANRWKATDEQKKQIAERKEVIFDALRKCDTLEDMLACVEARPYISGAWLDTTESMIIRKMRNNATRNFPKSLNRMQRQSIVSMDEGYTATQEEIEEHANTIDFVDVEVQEVDDDDET